MTRVIPRDEVPASEVRPTVLEPGMRLGRYELLCPIAEGGMAQVWAAEQTGDLGFRKLIALKMIRPDYAHDALFRAMFLDEAQLASRIRHVNVVEVLDLGAEGNVVYQAMTLIEGTSLSEWGRSKRIPVGVATRIAIDILRGLHAAHELRDDDGNELGLVHRDVSPQNVLVGVDGVTKLADFGIAKAFGRATEETIAGDVKGKVAYVAPEQLQGLPAAPQSDLFSAGVVYWELLTGERLFRIPAGAGASAREGLTVRDPREVAHEVPVSIAKVVMHALRDNPFDRYPTTLEMADALEEALRSEDLPGTQRDVAAQLERDMGTTIAARRERLRKARKRDAKLTSSVHVLAAAESVEPPTVEIEDTTTAAFPEPLPLPITRVFELQVHRDAMTDSVAVAEAPALRLAVTAPSLHRPSSGSTVPLLLAAAMLIGIVVVAGIMRRDPAPAPARATTVAPAPPPVETAPPPAETTPPPVVLAPVAVPAPASFPAPAPAPAVAAVPPATLITAGSGGSVLHRPIVPHGRTRTPATKPAPAAPSPSTAAPRFENPY